MSTASTLLQPLKIVIVGAGRMGRGIALAFAYAGHDAVLIDLKPRSAEHSIALAAAVASEIQADLAALQQLGMIDARAAPIIAARITTLSAADALAQAAAANIVFEAVPEVIEAKRAAFGWIGAHVAAGVPVASTTSTFLVTELAATITAPQRFLNAHWLNPAHLMPLVELSAHPGTAPATLAWTRELLTSIGKVPIVCAAAPGYIVPRLQSVLMNEAARMVEEGVASAAEIDKATRYGLGFRFAAIGVVEFIDFGGTDILYYASRYLAATLGDMRYAAPAIIDELMAAGHTGLKSGRGFADYSGVDIEAYRRDVLGRTLKMLDVNGLRRAPVLDRDDSHS